MGRSVDILLRNGLVFNGGLTEPFVSDIAVSDGKICSIGTVHPEGSSVVVDLKGMAVAPGFIDVHAHSDFTIIADPRAEGKICQGVTTEISGNCGMSAAPLQGKVMERRDDDLKELGISERWSSLSEYFHILRRKGTAVNVAVLAGHGNIRGAVVGYDDRKPSEHELSEMGRLLSMTLREGAIGLSTGLIYPPGIYADTEELIYLSGIVHEGRHIYASHMRSEGPMLLESIGEIVRIGRDSGVRVHVSHIKTAGEKNWGKADSAIALIEDAREQGVSITCDRYPYTASSTDLDSILPPWTFQGGNEEEMRRLSDNLMRERIRKEIECQEQDGRLWERIIVSSVVTEKNKWMEGKTITDICTKLGTEEISTIFSILMAEKLRVGAIFLSMSEDNLRKFLSLPYCAIGSDSSARSFDGPTRTGSPHPRTFGTFPRFIGKYIREERLLTLTEAIHRITMLPAEIFGLKARGQIKEGMYADLVVFDPATIADRATFASPYCRPAGIPYVLVNGTPAVWEGKTTNALSGMILTSR
jgi:N-acyl-D-amino-acid deacylase